MLLVLGLLFVLPGKAIASPGPEPYHPQADNAACLACHSEPGMTMQLGNGALLPLTVDQAAYDASIHGENGLACTACHKDITGYPHPEFTANDLRDVAIQLYPTCQECHADKYQQAADSVHQRALANGNPEAAVCSDCHAAHTQPRLTDPQTGVILPQERARIPNTCARCHNAIFEEYRISAHGELLLTTGNLDVPTCTECHGVHNIPDPTTAEFRLSSPQLCAGCHTDPVKMAKYGLSTQVLNTYVSDFHGTTVTLFQKTNPDQASNKPVCFDCHGAHSIAKVDDPERGLKIQENLLVTCQRCHPGATQNFPASWLSHYIPSPSRAPLIFFVNLFYWILIPGVIGGMVIFVISDIVRRRMESRKGVSHS